MLAGVADGGAHVVGAGAAGDQRRASIDGAVPDQSRLVIPLVARSQQTAPEALGEILDGTLAQLEAPAERHDRDHWLAGRRRVAAPSVRGTIVTASRRRSRRRRPGSATSAITTRAPSARNRRAYAKPMPDSPPVTFATLSASLMTGGG